MPKAKRKSKASAAATRKGRRGAHGSEAIRRELNDVQKELSRAQQSNRDMLYGAQQALTWVLEDTMNPSKAFAEVDRC